jgi:hypothetical protein
VAAIFRSANKVPFLLLFHKLCTSVYIFRLDRRCQRRKITSSNPQHLCSKTAWWPPRSRCFGPSPGRGSPPIMGQSYTCSSQCEGVSQRAGQ